MVIQFVLIYFNYNHEQNLPRWNKMFTMGSLCHDYDSRLCSTITCCSLQFSNPISSLSTGWLFHACDCAIATLAQQVFRSVVMRHSVKHPDLRRKAALVQSFSTSASTESPTTKCLYGALASPVLWVSPASWCRTAGGRSPANTSSLLTDWRQQSGWDQHRFVELHMEPHGFGSWGYTVHVIDCCCLIL